MIDSALKKLSDQFASFRRAIPAARASYAETLSEIAATKARIEFLRSSPLCRSDVEAQLIASIEAARTAALDSIQLRQSVEWVMKTPSAAIENDHPGEFSPLRLPKLTEDGLALVLAMVDARAALKVMAPTIASVCDDATAGPPLAERKGELATLSRRLAELEDARGELERMLTATGEDVDALAPPVKTGPKPGDRLPPTKNHHGEWVQGVWTVKPMPGDPRALTSGWEYRPCDPPAA